MSWNRNGWRMWMVMVKPWGDTVFYPYSRWDGSFAIHNTRALARKEAHELQACHRNHEFYVQMVGAYK